MASTLFMMPGIGLAHVFRATKSLNSTTLPLSSLPLKGLSLNLSSKGSRATGFSQWVLGRQSAIHPRRQALGFEPVTVVAAKGYKMKTHKASAKRFRVTGRGKIVRRRAGKQHLLVKKNTKRKNRLSKMVLI